MSAAAGRVGQLQASLHAASAARRGCRCRAPPSAHGTTGQARHGQRSAPLDHFCPSAVLWLMTPSSAADQVAYAVASCGEGSVGGASVITCS